MPNVKSVMAGLALSTALAGGVVILGAVTTSATAGTTTVTAGTSVINCGGGGGWRRGCCHRSCHRSCFSHRCFEHRNHRFHLNANLNNNNTSFAEDERRRDDRDGRDDRDDRDSRSSHPVNNTNNNNNATP